MLIQLFLTEAKFLTKPIKNVVMKLNKFYVDIL